VIILIERKRRMELDGPGLPYGFDRKGGMAMKRHLRYGLVCVLAGAAVPSSALGDEDVFRAAVDADGKQKVAMLGGSYFFRPSHVVVKAGVPVELSVRMEPGIIPHTLVIDAAEAGIAVDEELGTEPRVITFTPGAPGKYVFYCRNRFLFFKSHREEGMQGILEAIE